MSGTVSYNDKEEEVRRKSLTGEEGRSASSNSNQTTPAMQEPEITYAPSVALPPTHSTETPIPDPSTEAIVIHNSSEGAHYLARHILSACKRTVTDEALRDGAQRLLPLVEKEPVWQNIRYRVLFVISSACDAYSWPGDNGPCTWFNVINQSRNPIEKFIEHYHKITAATDRFLRDEDKKCANAAEMETGRRDGLDGI